MIYHLHFAALKEDSIISDWYREKSYGYEKTLPILYKLSGKIVHPRKIIIEKIKNSTEDSFIFIITKAQEDDFNKYIEELKDLIVYESPYWITNPVHPERGRNLKVIVLASSTHHWRDMYDEEFTETLENVNEN